MQCCIEYKFAPKYLGSHDEVISLHDQCRKLYKYPNLAQLNKEVQT